MRTDAWPTFNGDFSGRRFSPLTKVNDKNVKRLSLAWSYRADRSERRADQGDAAAGQRHRSISRLRSTCGPSTRGPAGNLALRLGRRRAVTTSAIAVSASSATGSTSRRRTAISSRSTSRTARSAGASRSVIRSLLLRVHGAGHRRQSRHRRCQWRRPRYSRLYRSARSGDRRAAVALVHGASEGRRSGSGDVAQPRDGEARRRHDLAAGHLRSGAATLSISRPETRSRSSPTPIVPGANLFTGCIVAINPDDGKMRWYFQASPHDTHDWDATQTAGAVRRRVQRPAAQADRAGVAQREVLRPRSHQRQGAVSRAIS